MITRSRGHPAEAATRRALRCTGCDARYCCVRAGSRPGTVDPGDPYAAPPVPSSPPRRPSSNGAAGELPAAAPDAGGPSPGPSPSRRGLQVPRRFSESGLSAGSGGSSLRRSGFFDSIIARRQPQLLGEPSGGGGRPGSGYEGSSPAAAGGAGASPAAEAARPVGLMGVRAWQARARCTLPNACLPARPSSPPMGPREGCASRRALCQPPVHPPAAPPRSCATWPPATAPAARAAAQTLRTARPPPAPRAGPGTRPCSPPRPQPAAPARAAPL
jgi:hypothetical protein